jgi:hypothetical protein
MQFLNTLVESNNYTLRYIDEIIEKHKETSFYSNISKGRKFSNQNRARRLAQDRILFLK